MTQLSLSSDALARIGPNAITRVAEALSAQGLNPAPCFEAAGLSHYLAQPPETMVIETEVIDLHHHLREQLGIERARAISFDAGLRTGDYLLAHRIPKNAQRILRLLPPGPSSKILLKAIGKHAWTFSGSGDFGVRQWTPLQVSIRDCPLCRDVVTDTPLCDFYTGAFERLFRTLVSKETEVQEIACGAMGEPACIFEMRW